MYKTIIIKNSIDTCIKELKNALKNIDDSGSIFCIVKTQYKNKMVDKDFMDVIEYGISIDLKYINTILIPEKSNFFDNILYCIWFVKNKETYYFNKDPIREKSIWKDVEWGKREKNYNSKGKDPGNVWIPTEDDGKANITNHILLNTKEIFDKLLSSTLVKNDVYWIIGDSNQYKNYTFNDNVGKVEIINNTYEDINFGLYENDFKKDIESKSGTVVFGTSESMDEIKENTVDLVVTSPPYWNLKDYYKKNQIGQESYEIYSNRMNTVWRECYNKLKINGSLWININIRTTKGKVILLPKLFINQCIKLGFIYRGILIWHKSSGIPTSSKNLSDHHEYVLIFTKSNKTKINCEYFKNYSDYKNQNISNKLFWNINRKAGSVGKNTIHPAIFPTELINRIVNVSTLGDDLVLDPFLGSGTSLIASINQNRNFIGYEFNEGFKNLMEDRFKAEIDNNDIEIIYKGL